jgi:hypothetical protein
MTPEKAAPKNLGWAAIHLIAARTENPSYATQRSLG